MDSNSIYVDSYRRYKSGTAAAAKWFVSAAQLFTIGTWQEVLTLYQPVRGLDLVGIWLRNKDWS